MEFQYFCSSRLFFVLSIFRHAFLTNFFPLLLFELFTDLGGPYFPGGPELWHHQLAYSAAAELPGSAAALQHATLVHPGLHPQMPVRSYL